MIQRLSLLLIFAGVGDVAHAVAETDPVKAFDICIERLFDSDDSLPLNEPLESLPLLCPELKRIEQALDAYSFSPSARELSLAELLDLRYSLASFHPTPVVHTLNQEILPDIIKATLEVQPEKELTWWDRLKNWLREKLHFKADPSWFDWLDRINLPSGLVEALLRGTVLIVIALALATVLNELRTVSWRWKGFHFKGRVRETRETPRALSPSWADIADLPLRAQGAALFRWVVARLASRRLALEQAAHTHREQARTIAANMPSVAAPLYQLAQGAERGIYAPSEPSIAEVQQWCDIARSIDRTLEGAKA